MDKSTERKMKANIFVHPKTGKEIFITILIFSVIIGSVWPVVKIVNVPVLVLGMPLLMLWSIGVIVAVVFVLNLANRWKVY